MAGYMLPFQELLDAGAPPEHIALEVKRHIEALRALPDGTEEKQEAISEAEAFLAAISSSGV